MGDVCCRLNVGLLAEADTPPPFPSSPSAPQIVSVDDQGQGIKRIRPKSLLDMLKVRGGGGG